MASNRNPFLDKFLHFTPFASAIDPRSAVLFLCFAFADRINTPVDSSSVISWYLSVTA